MNDKKDPTDCFTDHWSDHYPRTDWKNPDQREAALASKWAEACDETMKKEKILLFLIL